MKTFDYEQYRVVGLVEDKLGDNGFINVIGYCDDNLHVFHPLTSSEAQNLFPSRGKIFAYRFNLDYKDLKKSIVCLCVQPSNNDGKDSFDATTEYEANFRSLGMPIYRLILEKL